MGAWLADDLGPRYRAIGTAFWKGSFRTSSLTRRGLMVYDAPPTAPHFIEADIANAAGGPGCFIDVRKLVADPKGAHWARSFRQMRLYGSVRISERFPFEPVRIGDKFDGVFFLKETTPITELE